MQLLYDLQHIVRVGSNPIEACRWIFFALNLLLRTCNNVDSFYSKLRLLWLRLAILLAAYSLSLILSLLPLKVFKAIAEHLLVRLLRWLLCFLGNVFCRFSCFNDRLFLGQRIVELLDLRQVLVACGHQVCLDENRGRLLRSHVRDPRVILYLDGCIVARLHHNLASLQRVLILVIVISWRCILCNFNWRLKLLNGEV